MEPNERFIVWGGRGQAKVLLEIITWHLNSEVVAFFENDKAVVSPLPGVPIYYGLQGYRDWLESCSEKSNVSGIAAIGGGNGRTRIEFMAMFEKDGLQTRSLVHPTASILSGAIIGSNCQILAHAVVGIDVVLGSACIVNTKASVDHECRIADGVHIAPGVTLCGEVSVGEYSFIGAGSVLLPRVTVGSNVIVGAGTVVTRDIPDNVVVYGNPVRIIRENECV